MREPPPDIEFISLLAGCCIVGAIVVVAIVVIVRTLA